MKILYGVQSTGNGHITRARVMAPALRQEGIDVDFLFSGRAPEKLFNMEPFGNYLTRRGLTFVVQQGRVCKRLTWRSNSLIQLVKDIRALDLSEYDLVVSDFEPVTAWAAKLQNKPCVGVAHQYALRYPLPGPRISRLMTPVVSLFAPVNHAIGLHWHHFDAPILPPLIEPPLFPVSLEADKYLVYLPFESIERVRQWLQPLSDYRFHVYCDIDAPATEGHIQWRPFSRSGFQKDLASCSGIVANCGFGLASEVLQAGKKLLTKPLLGQPEQQSNAAILDHMGLAELFEELSEEQFHHWHARERPQPVTYPDVANALALWIKNRCREPVTSLAARLWSEL